METGALVDGLLQAARLSERRVAAQLTRLYELAGAGTAGETTGGQIAEGPGAPYWVTARALRQRGLRECRLLTAAAALAVELCQWAGITADDPGTIAWPPGMDGPRPPAGAEWGRTDAALEYWMRRQGWRSAGPAETHAAVAAAGGGGWCVHCGQSVHELRLFVRQDEPTPAGTSEGEEAQGSPAPPAAGDAVPEPAYRAFTRCSNCGLVAELWPGTVLAAAVQPETPGARGRDRQTCPS